jgi:diguanylate cyclase (GGDEF)-like protein
MKSTLYTILRLAAGILTVAALIAQRYIPPKVVSLYPNPDSVSTLYGHPRPDGSSAEWLDEERNMFTCEYAPQDPYSCGYALRIAPDEVTGWDLTHYEGLNILFHYQGNAPEVRLSLRNYNPEQNDPNSPAQSAKFMSVLIRTKDLNNPAFVRLTEFGVAEWWVREFDVWREHSAPDFGNVISLGVDFISRSTNTVTIEKIEVVGTWIRKETFYLSLIAMWMALILWEGFIKVYTMYRESRSASQRIDKLILDYKKLEVEKREFESLSITDSLTGVMNRTGIQQFLEKLFKGNFDRGQTGMLMFDIDHFKRINDRRGHDVGDRVLQGVAKLIEQNVRQTDVFGRWGGEEFILVCPQASEEKLTALAEKLRSTIHAYTFEEASEPLRVSVSIGATLAAPNEAFEVMFKRADIALYEAKNGGRNCVVFKPPTSG